MRSIRAGLLACALLVTLCPLTPCPPVAADPMPSAKDVKKARETARHRSKELGVASAGLVAAQSRLDDLAAGVERQVEAYNGELVRLRQAEQAYEQARGRQAAADVEAERARQAVALLAAESYSGMTAMDPVIGMLIDEGGVDGFLHRASVLSQLGDERARILRRMSDAQEVAAILGTQARNAYDAQQAASQRARQAKLAAEAAVARQRRETHTLRLERRQLQRRVNAARSHAELLARRRALALSSAGLAAGSAGGNLAANWALSQLGKPYVWAAAGPDTYDCSGLVMRAWEQVGVHLDHWTGTQWTSGPHVPLDQLRRGDLLFFGRITDDPGTIHHVGIYVGQGQMVHAPQTGDVVRVAPIWRGDLVGATRPR